MVLQDQDLLSSNVTEEKLRANVDLQTLEALISERQNASSRWHGAYIYAQIAKAAPNAKALQVRAREYIRIALGLRLPTNSTADEGLLDSAGKLQFCGTIDACTWIMTYLLDIARLQPKVVSELLPKVKEGIARLYDRGGVAYDILKLRLDFITLSAKFYQDINAKPGVAPVIGRSSLQQLIAETKQIVNQHRAITETFSTFYSKDGLSKEVTCNIIWTDLKSDAADTSNLPCNDVAFVEESTTRLIADVNNFQFGSEAFLIYLDRLNNISLDPNSYSVLADAWIEKNMACVKLLQQGNKCEQYQATSGFAPSGPESYLRSILDYSAFEEYLPNRTDLANAATQILSSIKSKPGSSSNEFILGAEARLEDYKSRIVRNTMYVRRTLWDTLQIPDHVMGVHYEKLIVAAKDDTGKAKFPTFHSSYNAATNLQDTLIDFAVMGERWKSEVEAKKQGMERVDDDSPLDPNSSFSKNFENTIDSHLLAWATTMCHAYLIYPGAFKTETRDTGPEGITYTVTKVEHPIFKSSWSIFRPGSTFEWDLKKDCGNGTYGWRSKLSQRVVSYRNNENFKKYMDPALKEATVFVATPAITLLMIKAAVGVVGLARYSGIAKNFFGAGRAAAGSTPLMIEGTVDAASAAAKTGQLVAISKQTSTELARIGLSTQGRVFVRKGLEKFNGIVRTFVKETLPSSIVFQMIRFPVDASIYAFVKDGDAIWNDPRAMSNYFWGFAWTPVIMAMNPIRQMAVGPIDAGLQRAQTTARFVRSTLIRSNSRELQFRLFQFQMRDTTTAKILATTAFISAMPALQELLNYDYHSVKSFVYGTAMDRDVDRRFQMFLQNIPMTLAKSLVLATTLESFYGSQALSRSPSRELALTEEAFSRQDVIRARQFFKFEGTPYISREALRAKYHEIAKRTHPDHGGNMKDFLEATKYFKILEPHSIYNANLINP
jgi:hypothetical protein